MRIKQLDIMNQRTSLYYHKAWCLALLVVAMIVCSCASSSKTPTIIFNHHQTLTSGILEENDTVIFPNHFIVEQPLDELDFCVKVSLQNMQKGDQTGVCVWVNGENHADAVVIKDTPTTESVIYSFVIDGKDYPYCSVFLGFPSKHQALLHIKRVDNDIVFYYPYDREVARIGLRQLYRGIPPEKNIRLMMYAVHADDHKPFTVAFDY